MLTSYGSVSQIKKAIHQLSFAWVLKYYNAMVINLGLSIGGIIVATVQQHGEKNGLNQMVLVGDKMKINIGAGKWCKDGWVNMDCGSPHYNNYGYGNQHRDIEYNLVSDKPFPFNNNCIDNFYCSMVFEHLPDKYVQHTLDECHRCLKKGGSFLVAVPIPIHDIRQFIRRLNMLHWGFAYNHAENGRHINFFTSRKLKRMFKCAGFTNIKRINVFDVEQDFRSHVRLAIYMCGNKGKGCDGNTYII